MNTFKIKDGVLTSATIADHRVVLPNTISIVDAALTGNAEIRELILPQSVKILRPCCFRNCKGLRSVNLQHVQMIGAGAFDGCTHLHDITWPDNLYVLNAGAFYRCTSLRHARISGELNSIGALAFGNCDSLEFVEMSNSIRIIETGAFWDATHLTQIRLSDKLVTIADKAFLHCGALSQLELPATLRIIGDMAFKRCYGLRTTIHAGVKSIGNEAFACNTTGLITKEGKL